jgi:hypothetical protein
MCAGKRENIDTHVREEVNEANSRDRRNREKRRAGSESHCLFGVKRND